MNAHSIVDVVFTVDHGAADEVITHGVVVRMHPSPVGIGRDDAEIVPAVGGCLVVIDLVKRSGIGTRRRVEGMDARAIGAADIELHDRPGWLAGDTANKLPIAGGGHGRTGKGRTIHRVIERHLGNSVGIAGRTGNGGFDPGGGDRGRVFEVAERRASVRFRAGVHGSWCAGVDDPVEDVHPSDPVEVETGVKLVGAGHPARPEADLVLATVDHGGTQRGGNVIVDVFGRASSDEAEDVVAGITGFRNDFARSVITSATPRRRIVEGGIGNLRCRCSRRLLNHLKVIDPYFARAQKAHVEFPPRAVRSSIAGGSGSAIGVRFPRCAIGFVAGAP